jgi:RNA polymerase sigma-70 factor (ECF subfamily)
LFCGFFFNLPDLKRNTLILSTAALHIYSGKNPGVTIDQQEESFIEIYKAYWPKLYAIAFNRLDSKQSAEDVVQEVMTGLWQRRKETDIHNLEAWLSAATRYAVFRQLTKYGSQRIVPLSLHPEKGYDQNFDYKFVDQLLREQINRLPEKCKLVFEYSRGQGLSNKEIAGQLDISEKTVEKHISKALHKLRHRLKSSFSVFMTYLLLINT